MNCNRISGPSFFSPVPPPPPNVERERERKFVMPILKDGTCLFFLYSFSRYCAVVFRKTQLEIMGLVHLIFLFYYYLFNLCVCVCFCVSGPSRRNELLPLKQTSPKSYLIIHWLSSPSLEFQPFLFCFVFVLFDWLLALNIRLTRGVVVESTVIISRQSRFLFLWPCGAHESQTEFGE